jgi:hypothetical protein
MHLDLSISKERGTLMKGWVYEVAEEADYNAGSPEQEKAFYFVETAANPNTMF